MTAYENVDFGLRIIGINEKELMYYKRDTVGFVWQNNVRNIVPYLSALENVEVPMILQGSTQRKRWAEELLDMVGLYERRNHKLGQLSGGEQQRVAIAIAIANKPKVLLADEPTGAVDSQMCSLIFELFQKLNKTLGLTIVVVTHDRQLLSKVDRVASIRDGRTSSEFIRQSTYAKDIELLEDITEKQAESHVEYAVVDKTGRLQYLESTWKHLE